MLKGHKKPPDSEMCRKNKSLSKMGKNNPNYGKRYDENYKKNMSSILKGRIFSESHRKKLSNAAKLRIGCKNAQWKGGRRQTHNGYVLVYAPNHPFNIDKYVFEHRLVMEAHVGRVLLPTEVVHHINGIKNDNRIENLMLFDSNSAHTKHHRQLNTSKD